MVGPPQPRRPCPSAVLPSDRCRPCADVNRTNERHPLHALIGANDCLGWWPAGVDRHRDSVGHQRRGRRGVDVPAHDHHDAGSQYTSIAYTERLAEAGIDPSVESVGDAYDNALAETVIGLFKTELIKPRGP